MYRNELLPSQNAVFLRATSTLSEPNCAGIILRGPPGAGKTWLARFIAQRLAGPSEGAVIEATGQRDAQASKLNPWRLARHGISDSQLRRERVVEVAANTLTASSKLTWGLSDILAVLLRARHRLHSGPATLNDDQYAVVHGIAKIVGDRPWALIADDLQWWDSDSIELLRSLFSERFRQSFPFFSRVRVIAIVANDLDSLRDIPQRFIRDFQLPILEVDGPNRETITRALQIFGVNDVNDHLVDIIQAMTGGHLQLVKEVGNYLRRLSGTDRDSLAAGKYGPNDLSWMRELFESRLDKAEIGEAAFVKLLESAAAIGVLFSENELRCLVGLQETVFSDLLRLAAEQALLDREGPIIHFRHAILQQILRAPTPARDQVLHRQYAQCLRKLNPGDYQTRAFHHRLGGENELADVMLILAATKQVRDGFVRSEQPPLLTSLTNRNPLLAEAAECLISASEKTLCQRHGEAFQMLDNLPCQLPLLLGAERAYLLADCRLKSIEVSDRQFSIDLLRDWRPRVEDEFDLWLRLSLTLIAAHALNEEIEAATEIERQLCIAIDQRQKYDADCNLYRADVYRRSDAIHDPEIAARRLNDAVAIFRGTRMHDAPCRPVAYVRAVTNLIGTRVVLGDYTSALNSASELAEFVKAVPNMRLPRPTTATNNVTLARALMDPADHASVVEAFAQTLKECDRLEDLILIRNNYVVCLVRAERLREADAEMTQCLDELGRLYHADAYYEYFVASNSFAIDLALNRIADPVTRWESLQPLVTRLSPQLRVFLVHRHRLLHDALLNKLTWTAGEWDCYLHSTHPRDLGRAWQFYGRGFLLSDLQHWSDG